MLTLNAGRRRRESAVCRLLLLVAVVWGERGEKTRSLRILLSLLLFIRSPPPPHIEFFSSSDRRACSLSLSPLFFFFFFAARYFMRKKNQLCVYRDFDENRCNNFFFLFLPLLLIRDTKYPSIDTIVSLWMLLSSSLKFYRGGVLLRRRNGDS